MKCRFRKAERAGQAVVGSEEVTGGLQTLSQWGIDMKKKIQIQSDTVYMMVNTRDRSKAGVISHAVNCGYSDEQLKNMAKFGWKVNEVKE